MYDDLTIRELKKGETLYREGDISDCAYLLESGSIYQYVQKDKDSERELRSIHYAGDFMGELALIGQRVRTTTSVAREATKVRVVRRNDIDKRLSDTDPLIQEFLTTVLGVLRNMLMSNWDVRKTSEEGLVTAAREFQEIQSITHALEQHEFMLYYQPIVRLSDRKIAGFEALIRWERPDYGVVPPAEFIPQAESSGVIIDIGRWAVQRACDDMESIGLCMPAKEEGGLPFVSVNLSGRQLSDGELPGLVSQAVKNAGFGPKQLKLEVTESELAQNIQAANVLLEKFRDMGVTVALDDFGTGQSSLEYLHHFSADTLKLDRSFVEAVNEDSTAMVIVRTVTNLAHELGMDAVGEGIETKDVADTLLSLGVEYGQGYYFARPMPLEDVAAYIEENGFI